MKQATNLLPLHIRKRAQNVNFKGRFRRSLIVGIIGTILLLLSLYFLNDSTLPSFVPSVLYHRNNWGPRVVIFTPSEKIDDSLCHTVGSAYLSGLPVVVAGYGMPFNGFMSKLDFMEKAIQNSNLQPEDVVVVIDPETVFTGMDINPFLKRFLEQTAATPDALDAVAVRQGRAMAPFTANADESCLAANIFKTREACALGYEVVHEKIRNYAAAHPERKLELSFDLVPHRHLNSGVVIARVWAYKEFLERAFEVTKTQVPPVKTEQAWFTDQSIYAALYLDLLRWEVEQDVFSMSTSERQTARSPYGLRAGLLGLDFTDALSVIGAVQYIHQSELHDELWEKFLQVDKHTLPHAHETFSVKSMNEFASRTYKRAYAAHGDKIYTKLAVPRWVGGKSSSSNTEIRLTPPLLSIKPGVMSTTKEEKRTYPAIFHTRGLDRGLTTVKQMEYGEIVARWLVPMLHDPKINAQTKMYLASVPLFMSTHNSITWDSYDSKCGFPFEGILKKAKHS